MRTGKRVGILWILLCALIVFPVAASQASLDEIAITNVLQRDADVLVYFDAIDTSGYSMEGLSRDMLTLSVDAHAVEVETLQTIAELDSGIAYIMLIDTSDSLRSANKSLLENALCGWVEALGPKDTMAVIGYGAKTEMLTEGFTADKAGLDALMRSIKFSKGKTYLYDGLKAAVQLASDQSHFLPDKTVIVLFTDGEDDGSMTSIDEMELQLLLRGTPLYAVGFGTEAVAAINKLESYVRSTGGVMLRAVSSDAYGKNIETAYGQLHDRITGSYRLSFSLAAYPFEGSYQVRLSVTDTVTDNTRAALSAPRPLDEETSQPETEALMLDEASGEDDAPDDIPDADETLWQALAGALSGYADSGVEYWKGLSERDRLFVSILIGIVLLLIVILLALLFSGRRRKKREKRKAGQIAAQKTPVSRQDTVPPRREAAPRPQVPPPPRAPDAEYEHTLFAPQPVGGYGEYDRTVAVPFEPSLSVAFQMIAPAGEMQKTESVSKHFVIGRLSSCDLQIKDSSISQRHAELSYWDGRLTIRDLQSTNGVYVNGVKANGPLALHSGDTIRMGNISIHLRYSHPDAR